jgi:hypothetical protein
MDYDPRASFTGVFDYPQNPVCAQHLNDAADKNLQALFVALLLSKTLTRCYAHMMVPVQLPDVKG